MGGQTLPRARTVGPLTEDRHKWRRSDWGRTGGKSHTSASEVGYCRHSGHFLESDIFKLHNPLCFQLSFSRESSPSHLTNPPPVKPLTTPTNPLATPWQPPPGLPFQPQHPAPPCGATAASPGISPPTSRHFRSV